MNGGLAALERDVGQLIAEDRLDQAEATLRPVLASGAGPIALWRQLVRILRMTGRAEEARQIQQMLVDAVPGDLSARFDLAEILLLLGEFDRGWREYHYRYSLPHTARIERKVQTPRWDGRPIPGRTLLIHDEQGFGDTFQFIRMLPWVKQRSQARVILEINEESFSLAARAKGFDALIKRGTLPPAFDSHCEMMSLPMVMGLRPEDLPGPIPYLSADPSRLKFWRKRLAALPKPRVALVWAGRPAHHNDANRSMKMADLAPLLSTGATFVAIQKGPRAGDAAGGSILSLSDEIKDFEDTAAILSLVDLLISVDSSPVHLAGALGRPAWVMLPFVPDWRWLQERRDTPWYPSVRLFRQPARGDWSSVIAAIGDSLARFVQSGPAETAP